MDPCMDSPGRGAVGQGLPTQEMVGGGHDALGEQSALSSKKVVIDIDWSHRAKGDGTLVTVQPPPA